LLVPVAAKGQYARRRVPAHDQKEVFKPSNTGWLIADVVATTSRLSGRAPKPIKTCWRCWLTRSGSLIWCFPANTWR
jgi:DTW domain-containing protein YfiP